MLDAQLGPVVGPLGRVPEGGRGWEGRLSHPSRLWTWKVEAILIAAQASLPTQSSVVSVSRRPSRVSRTLVSLPRRSITLVCLDLVSTRPM